MRNKWVKKVIMIGTFCLFAVSTWAASRVELPTEVTMIWEETTWEDKYDAPALKITITDPYLKAGKEERFILALQNATWVNRGIEAIMPYDLKGLSIMDVMVMPKNEEEIEIRVNIPSSIKQGDEISLTMPLLARTEKDEMYVAIRQGEGTGLIKEGRWLFAVKSYKQATWEVQQIPSLEKEGNMASIKLTEVKVGSIGSGEIAIKIQLQENNLAFGEPEYISKQVNVDDTDYVLDGSKYLEYSDGFQGATGNLKMKVSRKSNQSILLRISGIVPMKKGSILIKNIPIINTGSNELEQDAKITITGENLVDTKKDVVVAYIINRQVQEENQGSEEMEEITPEKDTKNSVQFKIGEESYTINGKRYSMDGEPYIKEPGYTMVPVRYVAMAFGVAESDISFANGMAIFKYGDKIIELASGSQIARANNAEVQMQTELVIKEGRVYAPIGEIAKILEITKGWDATNRIATFSK